MDAPKRPPDEDLLQELETLRRRVAELEAEDMSRAQTLLDAVVHQSSIAVAVVNPQGELRLMNEACRRLFGVLDEPKWRPGLRLPAHHRSFTLIDAATDTPLHGDALPLVSTLRGEGAVGKEIRVLRKDGTERYATMDFAPIYNAEGTLVAGFSAFHDITALKRAEQERVALETRFQQAQKMESLGVLAGGIAHDFNNLLMGVLGNAGLALLDVPPASPVYACLKGIKSAALRAKDLTSQMLAYSGRGRFVIELVSLGPLVEEMLHLLEVSFPERVTMRTDFAEPAPLVEADATQLRQVVMNLLTNASEALGEEAGEIAISTGELECDRAYLQSTYLDEELPAGQYAYLEVRDTGSGMSSDTLEHIFEPFFTTKFNGRGLGLAAVLGIVRGHHGALQLQSEPGQGTTIRVLFPAVHSAPGTARDPSSESLEAIGGMTVLLVDDDETALLVGRRMLERLGYEVVTARDGPEALALYGEQPDRFAVVLLDQTMPQMDGDECFKRLKELRPEVKVVLCSGYNEEELADRYEGLGLRGHLQKPYLPARLAKLLREVLQAR